MKIDFARITAKRENERMTRGISAEFFRASTPPSVTENSTEVRGLPHEEAQE